MDREACFAILEKFSTSVTDPFSSLGFYKLFQAQPTEDERPKGGLFFTY